jgi:hypothetical protein
MKRDWSSQLPWWQRLGIAAAGAAIVYFVIEASGLPATFDPRVTGAALIAYLILILPWTFSGKF